MEDQSPISAIRRKAGAGRPVPQSTAMSPTKALRASLARAADKTMQLQAEVLGVIEEIQPMEQMIASLADGGLILALEGKEGRIGVAQFDIQALAGMIEVQTTGKVVAKPAQDRVATRTDAAMVEGFVDYLLAEFEATLKEDPSAGWASGYKFGVHLDKVRTLQMILEDGPFRVHRISFDLCNGAKQGELVLALPNEDHSPSRRPGSSAVDLWEDAFEKTVLGAGAVLHAVLHRVTLPLEKISEFSIGDLVPVPVEAMNNVAIEGTNGLRQARARLGQSNGHRAVRILSGAEDVPVPMSAEESVRPEQHIAGVAGATANPRQVTPVTLETNMKGAGQYTDRRQNLPQPALASGPSAPQD